MLVYPPLLSLTLIWVNLYLIIFTCPIFFSPRKLQTLCLVGPHNWSSFCFCLPAAVSRSFPQEVRSLHSLSQELLLKIPFFELQSAEINVTDRHIDSNFFLHEFLFYLIFLKNDQTLERSGNIKALIPLFFQVTHSLSFACHLTVSLCTQSSNNPHHLPSGTSQSALCGCYADLSLMDISQPGSE